MEEKEVKKMINEAKKIWRNCMLSNGLCPNWKRCRRRKKEISSNQDVLLLHQCAERMEFKHGIKERGEE